MHILCIAHRVSDQGIVCCVCKIVGTLPAAVIQTNSSVAFVAIRASKRQHVVLLNVCYQKTRNLHRPIDIQTIASSDWFADPEGGAQEVRRFSMRYGCLIEKTQPYSSWQFRIGLGMFSLVTFLTRAYGARPSGRLRRSRRMRRSGYFLCAKESNSRTSAKKAPRITDTL